MSRRVGAGEQIEIIGMRQVEASLDRCDSEATAAPLYGRTQDMGQVEGTNSIAIVSFQDFESGAVS